MESKKRRKQARKERTYSVLGAPFGNKATIRGSSWRGSFKGSMPKLA